MKQLKKKRKDESGAPERYTRSGESISRDFVMDMCESVNVVK